jgi:hypothetical protein
MVRLLGAMALMFCLGFALVALAVEVIDWTITQLAKLWRITMDTLKPGL